MRQGLILLIFAFSFFGCQQQDPASGSNGKVYPSAAYLQYFGDPPLVEKGSAYAAVGFLPLADGSGKVLPMPFFLFSKNQHLDQILHQLFSDRLISSARNRVRLPFDQGVQLIQLEQAGDTLIVSLSASGPIADIDQSGIERAIVETATQFEAVSRVRVLYAGDPSARQPQEGYRHLSEAVASVPPPVLLDVVGVWEAEENNPKELLVSFDRPITVNSFRLLNAAGDQIAGKYFTSMFDMGIVVHPDEPEKFKPGTMLIVVWDVYDKLGRRNSALNSLSLIRKEH